MYGLFKNAQFRHNYVGTYRRKDGVSPGRITMTWEEGERELYLMMYFVKEIKHEVPQKQN